MTWILGVVQVYDQRKSPCVDACFFLQLFQDLVTASIAIEPGGLNYDLDTTWDMGLLVPPDWSIEMFFVFYRRLPLLPVLHQVPDFCTFVEITET